MVHGSQNNSWNRHLFLPHRIVVTHLFHSVPRCCNLHILKLPTVMRHCRIQASKVANVKTIGLGILSQPASSVKVALHLWTVLLGSGKTQPTQRRARTSWTQARREKSGTEMRLYKKWRGKKIYVVWKIEERKSSSPRSSTHIDELAWTDPHMKV